MYDYAEIKKNEERGRGKNSKDDKRGSDWNRNTMQMKSGFKALSHFSLDNMNQENSVHNDVIQRAPTGVAKVIKRWANHNVHPFVENGDDIFVPDNRGSIHLHSWDDGCKLSHCAGISGNLIYENNKKQETVKAAIAELQRLIALPAEELGEYGGVTRLNMLLALVQYIDNTY